MNMVINFSRGYFFLRVNSMNETILGRGSVSGILNK